MSVSAWLVRTVFGRGDRKRDRGLVTPEDVERFDSLAYGDDSAWHLLDVYRPKKHAGKLPVIVSVHGGAWVYGDKDVYQYYCMSLAREGFCVVNFTYRLAPDFRFPAQLEDTVEAFRWVKEHAGEYGFDEHRVFAVGDSAGAHLLSLLCCACTDRDYAKRLGVAFDPDLLPRAVALNCGVYRMEKPKGKFDFLGGISRDLLPQRGTEEELKLVSPILHLKTGFPPALVMTCEGDFLAPQAHPMAEALRAVGTEVEEKYYGGPEEVLGHVFHCNIRLEAAGRCNREECAYFRGFH
ncbi:MAG: alpha/beta hydrolase [Clostridia bacterium]|nr:alpha/beta hydrolase [Clostridia bacterium]